MVPKWNDGSPKESEFIWYNREAFTFSPVEWIRHDAIPFRIHRGGFAMSSAHIAVTRFSTFR